MPELPALTGASAVKRVGHKGADRIVPGNTPASFDAALAAGVDMVEFDVLPEDRRSPATTRLVLAHDYACDLAAATPLVAGLAHLAGPAFAGVELLVDLKLPGYEARVVDALRLAGLLERALVCSQYPRSLAAVRTLEPRLRLGWSVPRAHRDYTRSRVWALPALGALAYLRRRVPRAAGRALREGRCEALMAHWRLVTPRLVRAVREAGGDLYVWTVDDRERIAALERLGVSAVITNDPRLFGARAVHGPAPA